MNRVTKKSTRQSKAKMKDKSSFCANCSQLIDEDDHHLILETYLSNKKNKIDIKTVLNTIYNLDYLNNSSSQDEPEVVVCGQCHQILVNLFRFYTEFNQLRQLNSYLDQQVQKLDSLLHQIDSQNNHPIKSEDDADCSGDEDGSFNLNLDEVKMEVSSPEEANSDEDYNPDQDDLTFNGVTEPPSIAMNDSSSTDGQGDDSNYSDSFDPLALDEDDDEVTEKELRTRKLPKKSSPVTSQSNETQNLNKLHPCPVPNCDRSFNTKWNLKQHYRNIHQRQSESHQCRKCFKNFNLQSNLQNHLKVCPKLEDLSSNNEKFECTLCQNTFTTQTNLRIHMRRHNNDFRFPCPVQGCDKTFVVVGEMMTHKKRVHIDPHKMPFTCSICPKDFRSETGWKTHLKSHQERPFRCPKCHKKRFSTKIEQETHTKRCGGQKTYVCDICGKINLSNVILQDHLKIHAGEVLKCPKANCGKEFSNRYTLAYHVRLHDSEKIKCPDPDCDKTFPDQGNLTHHLCSRHPHLLPESDPQGQSGSCPVCGVTIVGYRRLKRHMQVHTEKPFTCHLCPKSFRLKCKLEEHVRRHEGQRTVPCSYPGCSKMFYRAFEVKLHMKTHTGEKDYLCPICGKASTDASNLKKHVLIHSDVKQFKCHLCDKAYKQPQLLKTHLKTHN